MERGLLWLPLLIMFFGLAWAGWSEYKKIEQYERWAANFENAKYDIYAVLGYRSGELVWGKGTRQGILEMRSLLLSEVATIELEIDGKIVPHENVTENSKGKVFILLTYKQTTEPLRIAFTQADLAGKWVKYLSQYLDQPQVA